MIFSNVKNISIPEGSVSRITDAVGRVLWAVSSTPGGGTDEPGYSGDPSTFPVMAAQYNWYKSSADKTTITEIELIDSYTPTGSEVETWYADQGNTGAITCYRIGTKVIIAGNGSGGINANADAKLMFGGGEWWDDDVNGFVSVPVFSSLVTIKGLPLLNTSNTTSMYYMFRSCEKLTSLNLSNFNTSNVTTIHAMFLACESLTTLDLTSFDTSKVTDMYGVFNSCIKLEELDISSFNTSKVTDMSYMFANTALTSLDVSNFNTSKVTNMRYMYYGCKKLIALNLSNFNTTNVTNMWSMFASCSALTSLDVSNFNTSKVTYMNEMFQDCSAITTLDLTSFRTTHDPYRNYMFRRCAKLTTIQVSYSWTITGVDMFTGCGTDHVTYI